ncbi:hypothetical protein CBER1_09873 [Cercospora berteroae]|uniref:N-acetyltransferase domain-containing protein n=1 Tax=Cercospora berteroae TaxID=357750 RepID=A0A2S6BVT8_9PEZI|nr:hypothetical protein CBER1_09873 [Cercospora berteroae]
MATGSPTYFLRRAALDDAPAIRAIEERSVQKFGTISELAHLAQPGAFTPNSISGLNTWLSRGKVFLAVNSSASDPKAVGVIAALPKDNTIYIAEVSVLEEHNGKGVGAMLLNAVFDWAREQAVQTGEEVARVSLTCYKDVPWNGPWYRRKGFVEVEAESLGIEHEEKMELDRNVRKLEVGEYKRCCMLWTERWGRV